jgi:MFS family permease
VIGFVEGVAETTSSLLKLVSGRLSDRVGRKWLAVAGYAISTLAKPAFALAGSWPVVAGARWADRVGKGVRSAPRDALVADSIAPGQRGLAFGFHRAADTGGAVVGLGIAIAVVWWVQGGGLALEPQVFTQLVWISLIPAVLGVLCLALGARETPGRATGEAAAPPPALRGLGRPFSVFLVIVGIFELGNSADAFLVLRAQERGLSVLEILCVLLAFNAVYALLSAPAGRLSDRVGRRPVLVAGWLLYAAVYLGFAVAEAPWHTAVLYAFYGAHYGLSYGTAKALVADLVPAERRGAAYGAYSAAGSGRLGRLRTGGSLLAGGGARRRGGPGAGPVAATRSGASRARLRRRRRRTATQLSDPPRDSLLADGRRRKSSPPRDR